MGFKYGSHSDVPVQFISVEGGVKVGFELEFKDLPFITTLQAPGYRESDVDCLL